MKGRSLSASQSTAAAAAAAAATAGRDKRAISEGSNPPSDNENLRADLQDQLRRSSIDLQNISSLIETSDSLSKGVVKSELEDRLRVVQNQVTHIMSQLTLRERAANALSSMSRSAESYAMVGGFTFRFLSWAYLSRLGTVILFVLSAGYLNALAAVIAGYRTPWIDILDFEAKPTGQKGLPDIGHDLLPLLNWIELPDVFVATSLSTVGVFLILHPKRLMIVRRAVFVFASLCLLRSFTVIATSLPDPAPRCIAQFSDLQGGWHSERPAPLSAVVGVRLTPRPRPPKHRDGQIQNGADVSQGLYARCAGPAGLRDQHHVRRHDIQRSVARTCPPEKK